MRAKVFITSISLAIIIFFTPAAAAAEKAPGFTAGDGKNININGEKLTLLYPCRPAGADLYVALCDFSVITGCTYKTYPGSGAISFKKGAQRLNLVIGSPWADINGRLAAVSPAPAEVDGTVYIPLKFTASCLGYSISSDSNCLSLNYNQYIKTSPGPTSDKLNDILPSGAKLIPAPSEGSPSDSIVPVSADLDGDKSIENASFYKGPDNKYGLLLYSGSKDQYLRLWQKEECFAPDFLGAESFGEGRTFLLAGWDMGDPLGSFLEIYSLEDSGLDVLYTGLYHRIEIGDFDSDGINELALWQKDQGDTYGVTVLKWNGVRFTPLEFCPGFFKKVLEYYNRRTPGASPPRALQFRKAEAFLKSGDFDQAIKNSRDSLRLPPGYPSSQIFQGIRGLALVEAGKCAEALPLLQSALGSWPGPAWPELRLALARCYFDSGRPDRGFLELGRALNEGNDWPGFDRAYRMFGTQLEQNKSMN